MDNHQKIDTEQLKQKLRQVDAASLQKKLSQLDKSQLEQMVNQMDPSKMEALLDGDLRREIETLVRQHPEWKNEIGRLMKKQPN